MRLCAYIIMRNEKYWLPRSLASIYDLCDRIFVVDNGSTDGSAEIADAFNYDGKTFNASLPEPDRHKNNKVQVISAPGTGFADPDMGYRKYMDEKSIIDFCIINELSKNVDAYVISTFLHKDKDSNGGKLRMGPIWDFNLAFGNASYRDAYLTDGFQVCINDVPWWWDRILRDTTFRDDIQERWYSIREKQYSDGSITSMIDSLSLLLNEAQERNFAKWDILGRPIWPNYYAGLSYEDEMDFLKNWTLERLNWLDASLSIAI